MKRKSILCVHAINTPCHKSVEAQRLIKVLARNEISTQDALLQVIEMYCPGIDGKARGEHLGQHIEVALVESPKNFRDFFLIRRGISPHDVILQQRYNHAFFFFIFNIMAATISSIKTPNAT